MATEWESISELRSHLPQVVDHPHAESAVTKTGKPRAVLLGIANYQALLALAQLARMPELFGEAFAEYGDFSRTGR